MWIPDRMSYWSAPHWIFKGAGEAPIPTYVKYLASDRAENYSQMTKTAEENLDI